MSKFKSCKNEISLVPIMKIGLFKTSGYFKREEDVIGRIPTVFYNCPSQEHRNQKRKLKRMLLNVA